VENMLVYYRNVEKLMLNDRYALKINVRRQKNQRTANLFF